MFVIESASGNVYRYYPCNNALNNQHFKYLCEENWMKSTLCPARRVFFLCGGLKSDLSFDSHIEGQAATFDLWTVHKPAVHALIQIPRSLIRSPRPAAVLYRIASPEFEYLVSPERQCALVKVKCL